MKKLIFALLFICCAQIGWGQISEEQTLLTILSKNDVERQEASKAKDYKKAEALCNELLAQYKTFSPEMQKRNSIIQATAYYNLACYRALQNKKKSALQAFELAVKGGWDDYTHTQQDSDLKILRSNAKFKELVEGMRATSDFSYILKQAKGYVWAAKDTLPRFTYMNPNDSNLVRIRKYFNLDSVAGSGDEISKIKNLLHWVHTVIRHDGSSNCPTEKNSIAMIELCRRENRGVNCRMMAQILNECYLAMGFKSRFVTCMPKVYVGDCHVINMVYSNTLNKWLWMDPTFNAYVSDEKGNLLGIAEVRDRLIKGDSIVLNNDANWNGEKQTQQEYLDYYMTKNLYYVGCRLRSEYNCETDYSGKIWSKVTSLVPEGYSAEHAGFLTSDDRYFWQSPYIKD